MSTATLRVSSIICARRTRSAFTLVELLVVITIVAILASLGAAAVMNALWHAKQTRIKVEVDQLDMAMKAFREKYHAYPPSSCAANDKAVIAFVAQAFPRYDLSKLSNDLPKAGAPTTYNPAQALVFWLRGFSPDVTNPFLGSGERIPFYNFDRTRLYPADPKDANGNLVPQSYLAPSASNSAFLYFDYRYYSDKADNYKDVEQPREVQVMSPVDNTVNQGYAVPYVLEVDNNKLPDDPDTYCHPDSFQIISAGQDGLFGTTNTTNGAKPRLYPIGLNYDEADADNVTNFCDINNLNDKKP